MQKIQFPSHFFYFSAAVPGAPKVGGGPWGTLPLVFEGVPQGTPPLYLHSYPTLGSVHTEGAPPGAESTEIF